MAKKSTTKSDTPVSFESAIERLEEITSLLESGDQGLDESLTLYSEGVALIKRCRDQLTTAETQVAKLLAADGTLTPLTDDSDDE